MNTLMKTASLGVAGVAAAALIGWQAPALADHGADDATSGNVSHRHGGDDDGAGHDAGDDHGRHGHDCDDNGNDDRSDDHGRHHGRGHDDGPNHDANDDHGGRTR